MKNDPAAPRNFDRLAGQSRSSTGPSGPVLDLLWVAMAPVRSWLLGSAGLWELTPARTPLGLWNTARVTIAARGLFGSGAADVSHQNRMLAALSARTALRPVVYGPGLVMCFIGRTAASPVEQPGGRTRGPGRGGRDARWVPVAHPGHPSDYL